MKPSQPTEQETASIHRDRISTARFLTDEEAEFWKRSVLQMFRSGLSANADLRADSMVVALRERVNGLRQHQSDTEGVVNFISETYYGGYGSRGVEFHKKLEAAIAEFKAAGRTNL